MRIKAYLIFFAFIAAWAFWTKSLYDSRQEARNENSRLNLELQTTIKQSQLKAEAFAVREQSLINDRKEVENEYKKLLELRKTDKHYSSWSDVALPDHVSKLMQQP